MIMLHIGTCLELKDLVENDLKYASQEKKRYLYLNLYLHHVIITCNKVADLISTFISFPRDRVGNVN